MLRMNGLLAKKKCVHVLCVFTEYAWVTLATNDSYSLGALVVAHSLKRVHTVHQLAVLITPGVSEAMKTKLRAVFNVVEEVNLLDSKDEANLALLKRPELGVTFTKLHCWRLTQFEKCVFLDADTLVLRNCDELFDREELSAAPDIGWPDCFNSGVYVYKPNVETFSSLLQYAVTHGSFDGGDQGLLNAYFSDWAHKDIQKHLPFIYNTSSVATYSYLPAFKQFGQNTKILHFIGVVKPWLQKFNSETRKVYVPSEYQHLANFLQYWWDIFAEDVHSRLSPDMLQALIHWIQPLAKVGANDFRSTNVGTIYIPDTANQTLGWQYYQDNGQQQAREEFVPSYEPTQVYVDPWEDYLQRQEREKMMRKHEEERLYFLYLDELRAQEHRSRTQYESLHEQQPQQSYHVPPHHPDPHHQGQDQDQHHDKNAFQRTEQWVDRMVQQHQENVGHWETPGPGDQRREEVNNNNFHSATVDSSSGGYQMTHGLNISITPGDSNSCANVSNHKPNIALDHHNVSSSPSPLTSFSQQAAEQPKATEPSAGNYGADGSGDGGGGNNGEASGLAGALAQVHLGEAKSQEQEAYEEHMRRQCWETGNIDYMGRDSFDNIWKRIQQTLNAGTAGSAAPNTEEKLESSVGAAAAAQQMAASQRPDRRRPSRSRSGTPKRDPKDRSPTPQPEEKLSVDKKEVHILPPPVIAEEDDLVILRLSSIDSSSISSGGVMRTRSKMPPPIQYDPTTNTTTLTKKVFAGYQQFITTKNPEGKTHTHMKLVYDPSVEDDLTPVGEEAAQPQAVKGTDQPDTIVLPVHDSGAKTLEKARVVAEERTALEVRTEIPTRPVEKPTTQSYVSESSSSSSASAYQPPIANTATTQTTKPAVVVPSATATATTTASTVQQPSQQQQQQQQLAPESLAGKTNSLLESKQPVKALRKKRHISPQSARPQPTTNQAASTNDQAPGKTVSSPSSSSPLTTPSSGARHDNQNASANQNKTSKVTASSASVVALPSPPTVSSNKTETSHIKNNNTAKTTRTTTALEEKKAAPTLTQQQSPEQKRTPVKQSPQPNNAQKQNELEDDEGVKVASSPPVPPRRKRESRTAKLGKTKKSKLVQLLLSCISCPKKKR
ncbi:AF4/FMR2 family member lilli [Anopheles maculipalpis]|uniref:AF4/FMR2 family member lilli n=1 Tax=Anopheles maculipalpis TaxID=1496333 RepID=UPI00215959E7|nr:AF4/FMR2 family member lilli [Anopheles maculipalpis]